MEKSSQNEVFEWSALGDFFDEVLDIEIEDHINESVLIKDKQKSKFFNLAESDSIGEFVTTQGVTESISYGLNKNKPQYSQVITGSNQNIVNLDGWQTAEFLKDLLRDTPEYIEDYSNQNFQLLIFSDTMGINTGLGKSSDGDAIAEMLRFVRDIPKENQYTNRKGDAYNDIPASKSEFLNLLEDDSKETVVTLDEAAQFLMYADQKWGKDMSQKIKLARHNNTHIIYIGHTGADIPADIRKSVIVCGKSDIKEGRIGFGILKGEGDQVKIQKELFKYENMPEPIEETPQQPDLIIPGISSSGKKSKEEIKMCQAENRKGERCKNEAVLFDETGLAVCENAHKGFYYNDDDELPKYHPKNKDNPHIHNTDLPAKIPNATQKLDKLKELSEQLEFNENNSKNSINEVENILSR